MRRLFVFFVFVMLAAPLFYFVGIKENIHLYGVEESAMLPSIQNESYRKKDFQKKMETWWGNHFLLRRFLLKTKNQIYGWMNLNQFHCAAQNTIVVGKNQFLYSCNYLDTVYNDALYPQLSQGVDIQTTKLKEIQQMLAQKGIDFMFVLAPSKARVYQDKTPLLYRWFNQNKDRYDTYTVWESYLKSKNIPYFNSLVLARQMRAQKKYEPFYPYGIHWNFYFAGRVVQESLQQLSSESKNTFPPLTEIQVQRFTAPIMSERDLGDLLNLWIPFGNPQQPSFRIQWRSESKLPFKTVIIGDSFSNEYAMELANAFYQGDFSYVYNISNKPLSLELFNQFMADSKLLMFVHTEINLLNQATARNIDALYQFLKEKNYHFEYQNWHADEGNTVRWSKENSQISIVKTINNPLILSFDIKSIFTSVQRVEIKCDDEILLEANIKADKTPLTRFEQEIPAVCFHEGKAVIKINAEGADSPAHLNLNADTRPLGLLIQNMTLHEKNPTSGVSLTEP